MEMAVAASFPPLEKNLLLVFSAVSPFPFFPASCSAFEAVTSIFYRVEERLPNAGTTSADTAGGARVRARCRGSNHLASSVNGISSGHWVIRFCRLFFRLRLLVKESHVTVREPLSKRQDTYFGNDAQKQDIHLLLLFLRCCLYFYVRTVGYVM